MALLYNVQTDALERRAFWGIEEGGHGGPVLFFGKKTSFCNLL